LEALYRSNGYTTGFFNSPHLVHQGERVQVNREILSHTDIVRYSEQLRPVAEALGKVDHDNHPSFFEFMVAMAFLRFAEKSVDIALLETGLGGRLDATNVVDPELSIITSISLDHTELLGDTIEAIAREKAGIIKEGKPVLIGKLPPEAETVIREIASERNAPLYSVTERFTNVAELPNTNLSGSFQRWNAAVAVYATELIAERFPIQSHEALQQIEWAGRWQTIQLADRTLILDATHNPEGAQMLSENLKTLVQKNGKRPIIVAGALGESRGRSLMQALAPHAAELHLVQANQPRATPTETLEGYLASERGFEVHHSALQEIIPSPKTCTLGNAGDTIVITGSLYLVGEALERLSFENPEELGSLQDNI
ncbi:MAG TPA: bifunctional folylpolyglutamate synthase/dihydrofolate synthase, partial [Opitutae bacterium]|nr:bifunctional folylpolyglutamate synthase/dihydrofolate synthase [Opitutae bacterium]